MVASAKLELEIKPIEAMQRAIDNLEDAVFKIADDTTIEVSAQHLPLIRNYPPSEAKAPFKFATDRSRKWYFANKFSKYGKYKRTGRMAQSWTVQTTRGPGVFTSRLSSSMNAALFVVGNLNGKRQVPGHKNTGWGLIAPQIEAWQADMLSTFFRKYSDQLGNLSEVRIV